MKIKLSKFFYSFILTLAFVFIFAGCGNGNALNKAEAENQNLYNQKEKLYSNQMYGKSSEKTDYEKPDEESLKKAAEKTDAKTKDIQPANSTDKSKAKNDKEQKTPAAEAESKKTAALTDEQIVKIIKYAYLTSINMFNRDVDVNENIGDGMFCRPKDKNLTYDSIIGMLNRHYSNSFISKSKIKEDCLKIVDNKVYVLLLEGNYTGKKEFEIIKRTDNPSSINVTVNLKSESDVIASQVVLIKESGSWKVESGSIFPSRELLYKK